MPREPGLERLWAPWRMTYVARADAPGGCLFCRVRRARGPERSHLVLARTPLALLMLNRFPYNPGHLMVAVSRHVARLSDLTSEERVELMAMVALAERALEAEYDPHGMNVGANLGRIAGAGYPGHVHFHIVPRWSGDTNFMPTVAGVKVLPESLDRTWRRLRRALAGLGAVGPRARAASRGRRGRRG